MHERREAVLRSESAGERTTQAQPRRYGGEGTGSAAFGAVRPAAESDGHPLSLAQERLWLLDQLEPGSVLYTIFSGLRLVGPLNKLAFQSSLSEVVRRHEVLRTKFVARDGEPRQVISDSVHLELEIVDLQGLPESEREAKAGEIAAQERTRPFDLSRGELFRVKLLQLAAELHFVIVTMPHIISDGWSLHVLFREVASLYDAFVESRTSPLLPLETQYRDYAAGQRDWLKSEQAQRCLDYWRERLAGAPPLTSFPLDHERPPMRSFRGGGLESEIASDVVAKLRQLCLGERATVFMGLLATFAVILHRYCRQTDIVIGSPVANRDRLEIERLIGFFSNTLPLRTDLSGAPTFRQLLRRVRDRTMDDLGNQNIPFETLIEVLLPERNVGHSPFFQAMLVMQPPFVDLRMSGLELTQLPRIVYEGAKFDLSLAFVNSVGRFVACWECNLDLFESASLAGMAANFGKVLGEFANDPDIRISDVGLLGAEERHRLLVEWNGVAADYPRAECLHGLFAVQAARTPEAVAIVCEDACVTYGELDRRANRLANHLRELGVGPEVVVGLCVERSPEMVVGLLGILKAGGAYLALDPSYPQGRLAYMVTDAQAPIVVTQARLATVLTGPPIRIVCLDSEWAQIARRPASAPQSQVGPDNIAYVLYTSGSTGRPKGVLGLHRGLVSRLHWDGGSGPDEVYAHKTTLNFIDAIWELFMPLIRGGRTVLVQEAAAQDPASMIEMLSRHETTRLVVVPSLLRMLLQSGRELGAAWPSLGYVASSGEPLPADVAEQCSRSLPGVKLLNIYGTSEFWDASWYDSGLGSGLHGMPLGRPLANMRLYVLDERLELVPTGVCGELYVGGAGLARGYVGRQGLTAERFLPSPFEPGHRLYRTGDLARWRADGELEFLGRVDHQVKIRGYRIEPGEIEAVLRSHDGVKDVTVVMRDETGETQLVAYVVAHDPARRPDAGTLRAHVRHSLPDYMMPAAFVALEALPLTPNGKVDRNRLPAPEGRPQIAEYMAPRTSTEEALAAIWAEVLKLDKVGVNDNFFDLGGHSLLLLRLHQRLKAALRRDFPLMALFRHPTVRSFEAFLGADLPSGKSADDTHDKNRIDIGRDRGQKRRRLIAGRGTEQRANVEAS
jgi:amino acid adenylation domain-containing protein